MAGGRVDELDRTTIRSEVFIGAAAPGPCTGGLPPLPVAGGVFRHILLPLLVLLTWPLAMGKYFGPASSLRGLGFVGKGHRQLASQLRSIAAESGLMLADALAGGRFTRYNDLLMPAGITAGAGDRLFDAKAEALRLQSEIPGCRYYPAGRPHGPPHRTASCSRHGGAGSLPRPA
ncbi:hypothetical protein NKH98_25000 [Mesorhizobium sp. M0833]|uniref:hypothetical protein n=1 Tax=Mesorhizobium sp. M0833 TaxID=2957009 RepID=UPI003337242A